MLKNQLNWYFSKDDKTINIYLDNDTPTEFVKEVAFEMIKHCGMIEDQVKAHKEQQEAEEKAKQEQENKIEEIPVEQTEQ